MVIMTTMTLTTIMTTMPTMTHDQPHVCPPPWASNKSEESGAAASQVGAVLTISAEHSPWSNKVWSYLISFCVVFCAHILTISCHLFYESLPHCHIATLLHCYIATTWVIIFWPEERPVVVGEGGSAQAVVADLEKTLSCYFAVCQSS